MLNELAKDKRQNLRLKLNTNYTPEQSEQIKEIYTAKKLYIETKTRTNKLNHYGLEVHRFDLTD
jgi:hypothetical protein